MGISIFLCQNKTILSEVYIMNITVKSVSLLEDSTDLLVIPVCQIKESLSSTLLQLDQVFKGQIKALVDDEEISDTFLNNCVLHSRGALAAKRLLFIGLGTDSNTVQMDHIRQAAGHVGRLAQKLKCSSVSWLSQDLLFPHLNPTDISRALAEGLVLGTYSFSLYQTKTPPHDIASVTIDGDLAGVEKGIVFAEGTNFARDLANQPSNELTPKHVVDILSQMFKGTDVKVTVIDRKKAEILGMGGLVGVGKGSINDPYLVVLEYKIEKDVNPIALVGKGVTFDSGGISIKPSLGMSGMKGDMGGAAAVAGAFKVIERLKPQKALLGIIPLAENMPSAYAQKPGDVIRIMNNTTVEVINTDAEGRLILADALCYAVNAKASKIIDIATLTGAAIMALGNESAAIMGNQTDMINTLKKNVAVTGERVWELPLFEEYLEYMKSDIADLMNAAEGKGAGSSSAGKFLEQFVSGTDWVHIDMAPMMSTKKTSGHLVKGMSGYGVRTLAEFVIN
jgi:leucyl aminopeptidase